MDRCIAPPELQSEQIAAYLDGEADDRVRQHLERCTYCRTKAVAMAQAQNEMRAMFFRRRCPTSDELRDYHFDLLDEAEAVEVTRHLYTCPHCTHDLFALRKFIAQEVVVEAQPTPSLLGTVLERIRFVVAELIQGGGSAMQPAYGVRGAKTLHEATDHLLYKTGDLRIGLNIQTDLHLPEYKIILGSIIGSDIADTIVHLWKNNQLVGSSPVDELGSFMFTGLLAGRYDVIISNTTNKVLIAGLAL